MLRLPLPAGFLLAGLPRAEYIRRRRLTLAAFALQRGEKVIDVALCCGYEPTESFSRAFKGLHRIPPSAACRKGAVLQVCPPIAFHISVRGDVSMQYRIEQIVAFGADAPMGRAGEPADIAPTYVYLASKDARYVTGQTLHVNGGVYFG